MNKTLIELQQRRSRMKILTPRVAMIDIDKLYRMYKKSVYHHEHAPVGVIHKNIHLENIKQFSFRRLIASFTTKKHSTVAQETLMNEFILRLETVLSRSKAKPSEVVNDA